MKLPPSAKVLKTRLPAQYAHNRREGGKVRSAKKVVCGEHYAAGDVVAGLVVRSRPVPFSVAIRGKNGGAPVRPKLKQWRIHVQAAARLAMAGRLPHIGPYEFRAKFLLTPAASMPDICNIVKSSEDALEGIVYINDKMCRRHRTEYDPAADEDMAIIEVVAL
jgi:hypothetical protein